ncbi:aspartyl/asparaginyl beta-hydroxylase domain-containing protein [Kangiella sp. HZ709]|uniref:aspartyl/asparaginyl beta-hydroxylase domain-containing protein n=1 Tax=Kangiella sp. HZ709 TaxID=2666328 RepID=UPI0012B0955A|nr:aspartyl/asparaginyl beta-hydroxylase domain-containing protein [Kangiella sp. HZ709]MRX26961.1 hypothetical protein [Kangiella sp. HZ709]
MNDFFESAFAAYKKKNYNTALSIIDTISSKDSGSFGNSLQLKAQIYFELQKTDSFITTLKEIYQFNPNDKSNLLALIIWLNNDQKKNDAFNYLNILSKKIIEESDKDFFNKNVKQLSSFVNLSLDILKSQILDKNKQLEVNLNFKAFVNNIFNSKLALKNIHSEYQRPTYLHYPGLKESAWHNTESVKQLAPSDFQSLKEEIIDLFSSSQSRPYYQSDAPTKSSLESLRNNENWSSIILQNQKGVRYDSSEYPVLASYIKQLPLADCPPHAPEVMLSILKPGTHIPPHYGLSNFKLTLHLPIMVPKGELFIKVGDIKKTWKEGVPLLFDDSYIHEAINNSEQVRLVLIADIWHPSLSSSERILLQNSIEIIDNWHKYSFNHLFSYGLQYN